MPTSPYTSHALAPAWAQHRMTAIITLIAVAAVVLTLIIVLASGASTPRGGTSVTSHSSGASNAGYGLVP
jgi:hypothetical protein